MIGLTGRLLSAGYRRSVLAFGDLVFETLARKMCSGVRAVRIEVILEPDADGDTLVRSRYALDTEDGAAGSLAFDLRFCPFPITEIRVIRGGAGDDIRPFGRRRKVVVLEAGEAPYRLASTMDARERQRAATLIGRAARVLDTELAHPCRAVVAGRARTEPLSDRVTGGSTAEFDRNVLSGSGDTNYFAVCWEVSGVWWGGGCVVTGRRGKEVMTGIRGYLALRWHSQNDPSMAGKLVEYLPGARSRYRRDVVSTLERGERLDLALGLTLALYDRFQESNAVPQVLRELTAGVWGRRIGAGEVIGRLRDAGVAVPF